MESTERRTIWSQITVKLGACLFAGLLIAASCAALAQAKVGAHEVMEYQRDFGVPAHQAEEALEIQDAANEGNLVGGLEARLGRRYAGIWFDNEKGEYVVPTLSDADSAVADSALNQVGLGSADFRLSSARSSWDQLESAQREVDATLDQAIAEGFVDTSLDPRANAIVVTQTSGAGPEVIGSIQQAIEESATKVAVRKIDLARFDGDPEACAESYCDAPLRGGVRISPPGLPGSHCTAGFPAIGSNGARYLITAGHCVELYAGAPLNLQWESKDSLQQTHYIGKAEAWEHQTFDWAKINGSGSEWDYGPWSPTVAYWGEPILNQYGTVIGKTPAVNWEYPISGVAANVVGNYACHSGIMTGTTCGYITGVNVSHTKAEHTTYGLVKLANACSEPGDSGGPYFMGHSALGLHIDSQDLQKVCGDTLYYSDIIQATSALNVSIAGSPPPPTWRFDILGGATTADPDIASDQPNRLNVFLKGTDGYLWQKWWTGSSWSEWVKISEALGGKIAGGPGAVSMAAGRLDVVARMPDNTVGHWYYDGAWHYDNLGGNTAGDPDIASDTNGHLNVFVKGAEGELWQKWWTGSGWSAWQNLSWFGGGKISGGPGAVSWGPNRFDVVARMPDSSVGHWWYDGSTWHYDNLGGGIINDPDIASDASGHLNVFVEDMSGNLVQKWWTGSGWSAWQNLSWFGGGALGSGPGGVSWDTGRFDVVARMSGGDVGHWWYGP
jgi:hypothetical protein